MSMEFNEWVDWGQSDWDNGWTNNVSQSFNRQTTPKEQGSINRGGKTNQSTSGYFEKNSLEDDWIIQNQSSNVQGQNATYSLEAANNNNSLNQIENKEIAPPDNRQSYTNSQVSRNQQDAHNIRPKQSAIVPPQSSKPFTSQRQTYYNNVESSNISNYFKSNQVTQVPSSHSETFSQPFNVVNNQAPLSGPASFGGSKPVRQQQLEEESQFSSLGHQTHSQELASRFIRNQQNSDDRLLSGHSSAQLNTKTHQEISRPPTTQIPSGAQQLFSQSISLQNSVGVLHSGVPQHLAQHPAEHPISDLHQHPAEHQNSSVHQHPAEHPNSGLHQHPAEHQNSSVHQLPAEHQNSGVHQHPAEQQNSGVHLHPAEQQNSVNSRQLPQSKEDIDNVQQHGGNQSLPPQTQRFSPPQQHPQQQIANNKNSNTQPPPPSMPYPSTIPANSEFLESRTLNHNSNLRTQSFDQVSLVNSSSPIVTSSSVIPPNIQSPPQFSQVLGSTSNEGGVPVHQLSEEEANFSSLVHQGPSFQQTSINATSNQNNIEVNRLPSGHSSVQSNVGMHQQVTIPHFGQTMTTVPQQSFALPQQNSGSQQQSSNFKQQTQMKEAIITARQPGDNHSPRYSPSPLQQVPKSSSNIYPPPPLESHPPQVPMKSEVQDQKTNLNSNNFNHSSFQVSSMNIFPPMATSSPLVSHSQLPENQERIPENREYPDNAEDIVQDLKALKISPSREAEQEAQKHCAIDRNQYLETGQFSAQKENNTYIQNIEVNDEGEAPPPGLHRLVTGQGYEPWRVEPENVPHPGQSGESAPGPGTTRHSSPLSSIGDESEGRENDENERRREVPGEAEPLQGRVVLGQVPTPPDAVINRGDRRERERLERMVVGEHGQSGGNTSDDYRQGGRLSRHTRHRRNDSSYEKEERDYSSDRDRRKEDHRRRDDRPRRRREHRSPEYQSDEEYDERHAYRTSRESRRMRDYSPDRSYYRDYYREEDHSRHPRHYYHRDYDDYYRENPRSRPSSRSGSDYRHPLKHSMRVLPGHHYYEPSSTFHDYMKYSSQREYFERMRQVDPAGYAAWYYQYMQGRFRQESTRAFSSDRASVHSGQSSSNQRQGVSTPQEAVDDLTREEEEEVDYTTRLYDCAHIRGNMDGHGRLIVVEPNYPLDQQKATVNICRLSQVSHDKDSEDFFQSPGPFIPGVTHRNTVLQYLKRISDKATKSSEKLLYDLVHMTVKGNGEVNGSDVAELLMESYKNSTQEEQEPVEVKASTVSRFRELLQQGNKAEALEWAMENGAWGHAMFLASKMGERTHNDIMLRFANSIPHNDPLQTLYQLMSGYIPQAATCCADKKWSDWRPHLAMMLSNPTGNITLDRQAIITLGDSLNASGRLFASHFCYVTAQVEFSHFRPDAKLVLLGSSHNQEFSKFATCRAIMLTMCYEYGLKLRQPLFNIPTLQVYKLILAARLIDNGKIRNALQYCELLAQEVLSGSTTAQKSLISTIIDFASRLKMFDPVLALSGNTEKDPEWLNNLKQLHDNLQDDQEEVSHNPSPLTIAEPNVDMHHTDLSYQVSDSQPNSFIETGLPPTSVGISTYQTLQQPSSATTVPTYQSISQPLPPPSGPAFQPLTQMVSQLPPHTQAETNEDVYHQQSYIQTSSVQQHNSLGYKPPPHSSDNALGNIEINSGQDAWEPRMPPPVIQPSSEASHSQRNSFFKATEEQLKAVDENKPTMKVLNEVGGEKKKDGGKQPDPKGLSKNEEQSSGWFGGIWEKIALRPKNQMRLPDDSNPSIIWDEKKKKWVNLDGESESSGSVKPPPKASEALPPQGNKYKIQKGKLMKSNYVDVMGNKEKSDPAQANFIPGSVPPPVKTNFFIPPPVEGNENAPVDFITPAPHNPVIAESSDSNNKQLSRSSSVSSLSREVQFYMAPPQGFSQSSRIPGNPPHMYNPPRYTS